MQREEFISTLKAFIPDIKTASGRTEMVTRCRFCGDSKNPKHAHLYIKVPQSDDDISLYECKKCKASGIVNDKFLRTYGCNDPNVLIEMAQHINRYMKSPKFVSLRLERHFDIYNNYISDIKLAEDKLNYINTRLECNINITQAHALKIFFNLNDILKTNNFKPTRDYGVIRDLSNHFLGFISHDNTMCILRKYDNIIVQDKVNKRYINYRFSSTLEDTKTYYVIPTTIISSDINPVKIHITEGVFDILSIYINLNNMNNINNIYMAAAGKSYYQALQYILEYSGLINYEIHLYPDNDVDDSEFEWLTVRHLRYLPTEIFIHRNMFSNMKDYGVPYKYIKDFIRKA